VGFCLALCSLLIGLVGIVAQVTGDLPGLRPLYWALALLTTSVVALCYGLACHVLGYWIGGLRRRGGWITWLVVLAGWVGAIVGLFWPGLD
jgi:hypothetical protein